MSQRIPHLWNPGLDSAATSSGLFLGSPSTHDFWIGRRLRPRDLYTPSLIVPPSSFSFLRLCPETRRAPQPDGKMVNITDKIKE